MLNSEMHFTEKSFLRLPNMQFIIWTVQPELLKVVLL
jgi:hypothetical protein